MCTVIEVYKRQTTHESKACAGIFMVLHILFLFSYDLRLLHNRGSHGSEMQNLIQSLNSGKPELSIHKLVLKSMKINREYFLERTYESLHCITDPVMLNVAELVYLDKESDR